MELDHLDVELRTTHLEEGKGLLAGQKRDLVLPPYDQCEKTKWLCLAGLVLICACAFTCIASGSVLLTQSFEFTVNTTTMQLPSGYVPVNGLSEVYSLIITGCLTICMESTGFIHDVCLRWNLDQERRLRWVTNLRLLSASKKVSATRWPSNILYFIALALAYTAASQIFVPTLFSTGRTVSSCSNYGDQWDESATLASAAGVMTLGACLTVQATLSTWMYLSSRQNIMTWSSSPLTITLACISSDARLADARITSGYPSLLPAASRLSRKDSQILGNQINPPSPMVPRNKQPSLFQTRKITVCGTLLMVSVLPVLLTVWAAIVINAWNGNLLSISISEMGSNTAKLSAIQASSSTCRPPPAIQPFSWQNDGESNASVNTSTLSFICLLLVFCIQTYLTFALHCVEAIMNSTRDQRLWERAAKDIKKSSGGVSLEPNPIISFLKSPPNVLLLVSKTVAHWLFNGSLLPVLYLSTGTNGPMVGEGWQTSSTQIYLFGVPTLFLTGVTVVLLAVIFYLAFRRPSGPQPSTYGHIQTLAELIDDWGEGKRLFWGDKGLADDGLFRRAGTSGHGNKLEEIHPDKEYI